MKFPVAVVVFWATSTVSASSEQRTRRATAEKEQRSLAHNYLYEVSVVRPIQQELKEQYEEPTAEQETPTASPTLSPSESSAPSDVPSLPPSDMPSLGPSELVLPGAFEASAFPSLTPSQSPGPSVYPSLAPSMMESDLPSLIPSEVASDLPSFVSEEILRMDLTQSGREINVGTSGVSFCLVSWISFITCATVPNCFMCDRSSPGLVPGNECTEFDLWKDTNDNCCENNECGEYLEELVDCKNCAEASQDSSFTPSESPSTGPLVADGLEEFPTLSPSASPGPSDSPSLVPSEIESAVPSMFPSDVPSGFPSGDDAAIVGAGSFPTLGPSSSSHPSSGSDTPSLVPSDVPSGSPSGDNAAIGGAESFPTLGPSESTQPFSGSDTPSLVPSDLPSLDEVDAQLLNISGRGQVNEEAMPGDDPVVDMGHTNGQIIEEPLPREDPVSLHSPTASPSEMRSNQHPLSIVEELMPDDNPIDGSRDNITCDLDATIECETTEGEPCLFSHIPPKDAMCQDSPILLSWIYKGLECGNSTRSLSFVCEDLVDGWPTFESSVYIEIHGEEADELYYQGFARKPQKGALDSIIHLNRTFSNPTENLFVHIKSSNQNGELLQILAFPQACDSQEGLVIGDHYGALQFGSYVTNTKSVQGFKHLEWTFAATSEAGRELTIKTATVVVNGMNKTFSSGAPLSPGEEASFVYFETISLGEADMFSGAVVVVGEGADLRECAATAASYFEV